MNASLNFKKITKKATTRVSYSSNKEEVKSNHTRNQKLEVITHNGLFHADEVVAIALLKIFTHNDISVVRTRDVAIIQSALLSVDVGGKYWSQPYQYDSHTTTYWNKAVLDHHQLKDGDEFYGLSSAGLVWRELNREVALLNDFDEMSGLIKINESNKDFSLLEAFIEEVDAQDVGIKRNGQFHLCQLISALNEQDINSEAQNIAFAKAVDIAVEYINNLIEGNEFTPLGEVSKVEVEYTPTVVKALGDAEYLTTVERLSNTSQKLILEAFASSDKHIAYLKSIVDSTKAITQDNISYVILDKTAPFIPATSFVGKADFVISFDKGQDCWSIQPTPLKLGEFGSKYKLLPTKQPSEVFTHPAGFISKVKEVGGVILFNVDGVGETTLINISR